MTARRRWNFFYGVLGGGTLVYCLGQLHTDFMNNLFFHRLCCVVFCFVFTQARMFQEIENFSCVGVGLPAMITIGYFLFVLFLWKGPVGVWDTVSPWPLQFSFFILFYFTLSVWCRQTLLFDLFLAWLALF